MRLSKNHGVIQRILTHREQYLYSEIYVEIQIKKKVFCKAFRNNQYYTCINVNVTRIKIKVNYRLLTSKQEYVSSP